MRRYPKLILGANDALLALDRSPSPAVVSGPVIRSPADLVDGLGLSIEQRQALEGRVQNWMAAANLPAMRKALLADVRGLFPGDAHRRQEVVRRAAQLWERQRPERQRLAKSFSQSVGHHVAIHGDKVHGRLHEVAQRFARAADHALAVRAGELDGDAKLQQEVASRIKGTPTRETLVTAARDLRADPKFSHLVQKEVRRLLPDVLARAAEAAGVDRQTYDGSDDLWQIPLREAFALHLVLALADAGRVGGGAHASLASDHGDVLGRRLGDPAKLVGKLADKPKEADKTKAQELERTVAKMLPLIFTGQRGAAEEAVNKAVPTLAIVTEELEKGWQPIPNSKHGGWRRPVRVVGYLAGQPIREFEHWFPGGPQQTSLFKGAGHKYVRRDVNPKPPPKYRYWYHIPGRTGLVPSDKLQAGTKFKGQHKGQEGHYEVVEHMQDKGIVRMRHDETKETVHIREKDLKQMLEGYHSRAGTPTSRPRKPKATGEPKPEPRQEPEKPEKPRKPRLRVKRPKEQAQEPAQVAQAIEAGPAVEFHEQQPADLQDWDEIIGFASTPEEAQRVASQHGQKANEYATVKQPRGYIVATRTTRKPPEGEVPGGDTKVYMRDRSGKGITAIDAEYVVLDASKVIASHNPLNMAPREDYPKGVQERRYEDLTGEQLKVHRIAASMEPRIVANTNPDVVNGTPVITEDGVVLGGNGRTMGMQLAYAQHPESGQRLKDFLTHHAREFGLRPNDVAAIEHPILVRRIKAGKDTDQLRQLGRRMNESLTRGLDPRTMEVALGKNYVDKHLLGALVAGMDFDESLADFLHNSKSVDFVKALERSGIIDDLNRDEFVDADGMLNEDGRARVERVLAARLLPDAAILSRMNQKTRQSIARSTPYLIRAEDAGWDVRESLMAAVKADLDLRTRRGQTEDLYLSQEVDPKLDPDHPALALQKDPLARLLFTVIRHHNGPNVMAAGFRDFARRAETAQHMAGGGLFGEPPEKPEHALDGAFGISKEAQQTREQATAEAEAEQKRLAAEFGLDLETERKRKIPKGGRRRVTEGEAQAMAMSLTAQIAREIGHSWMAQATSSALTGQPFNKAKARQDVSRTLIHALAHDPRVARGLADVPRETVVRLMKAADEQIETLVKSERAWWESGPRRMLCPA